MQRTDYVFKVANRSKTESQNSKQNHKTQNRNTKLKTESQNPKQNHKTQITKPKAESQNPNHKTQNRITKPKTESQNSKQNQKTQNRIAKPKIESQNSIQNQKTQNRITPVVPSKTIPDSRTKWAKCIPVFRPKRLTNIYPSGRHIPIWLI